MREESLRVVLRCSIIISSWLLNKICPFSESLAFWIVASHFSSRRVSESDWYDKRWSRSRVIFRRLLVKLSDGSLAGVIGVNHDDLLNPQVIVYDAEIPKDEAAILDLSEMDDLNIEDAIRRNEAPQEVLEHLDFGGSLNYFMDPSASH